MTIIKPFIPHKKQRGSITYTIGYSEQINNQDVVSVL